MDKNENINITIVMNGFSLEYSYRYRFPTPSNPENWEYGNDRYYFKTWDEALDWMKNNPMTFPPTKI